MNDGPTAPGARTVLVRSDPADVGRAGVFAPLGFTLRPEIAAISMSGSSILVAVNALLLKRLDLPPDVAAGSQTAAPTAGETGSPESDSAPRGGDDDAVRPAA